MRVPDSVFLGLLLFEQDAVGNAQVGKTLLVVLAELARGVQNLHALDLTYQVRGEGG